MEGTLLGRDEILDTVEALAFSGETVLVYGPLGIGKTAILGELARRAQRAGRPCGICPRTERLSDVTEALVRCYSTGTGALTQRQRRSRVRLAIERKPGILLLDHLLDVGNAVKGYLRSLHGTGLGVVIAADVEQPARSRARSRPRTRLSRAGAAAAAKGLLSASAARTRDRVADAATSDLGSRSATRSSRSRRVGQAGSCVSWLRLRRHPTGEGTACSSISWLRTSQWLSRVTTRRG